jgi:hypothetical protein
MLPGLLILFVGIPLLVTLAVPRRYFGFYVAWVAMIASVIAVSPSGRDHSSPFSGIGEMMNGVLAAVFFGAIVLRLCVIAARNNSEANVVDAGASQAFVAVSALTGVLTGLWGVVAIPLLLSAIRPTWIAHGSALAVVIVALALCGRWRTGSRQDLRMFSLGFAASAVITAAIAAIWICSRIGMVIDSAEAAVSGKPYCIQVVAPGPDFAAASSRLDLSPVTMRAPCPQGWCWQNHAILAIDEVGGRRLMNWSHRRKEFRADVLNAKTRPPAIICEPVQHFARDLPIW